MELTELSEFGPRRKLSEPKYTKVPMATILMEMAWAQAMAGFEVKGSEVKGSESFRVVSKESPITELK